MSEQLKAQSATPKRKKITTFAKNDPNMEPQIAIYPIPQLGQCQIRYQGELLLSLTLSGETCDAPAGQRSRFSDELHAQVLEYLAGERASFSVAMDMSQLTQFQGYVLRALSKIPFGQRRSYGQIAHSIGRPKAARAVGAACNRNPFHLIIPCHRVVGADGALVGYAAGVEIKRKLLDLEGGSLQ